MATIQPQSCHIVNRFEGAYAQRFAQFCSRLSVISNNDFKDRETIHDLVKIELDWISNQKGNELDNLRYQAFVLLMRDLLNVSWKVYYSNQGVEIFSPPPYQKNGLNLEEQSRIKDSVRDALAFAREEQLSDPATLRFINLMENPQQKSIKSIRSLLANGSFLAQQLERVNDLPGDNQLEILRTVIKPYLVLVESDKRDPYTGIRYGDIWRYFRLIWAIPNVRSPGRKLLYLIRDEAQDNHPIMAIAALSNSALQVKDRDDFIGWTAESVIHRLQMLLICKDFSKIDAIICLLERYVERGLTDIDNRGLLEPKEILYPDEATLRKLQYLVDEFSYKRQKQLQLNFENNIELEELSELKEEPYKKMSGRELPKINDNLLTLDRTAGRRNLEARRQLVFKKRSLVLYQLLYARRVFQQIRSSDRTLIDTIEAFISRDEFRASLTYAIYANKRERVGINMLEITTCGAVPPYNSLLGGKLMALLLLSPQVVADYRRRYGAQPSLISSQVKGDVVVRPSDLVFLSTTSLYSVGSSQYNRLSLPEGTYHQQQPKLEYKSRPNSQDISKGCLPKENGSNWQTSGYGTVHFSTETTEAIVSLGIQESGYREVNSIFGEGPSPKLRKIRSGLQAVGLEPDILLRHNQPRLLYCVELCEESRSFLNGEDVALPEYIMHPEKFQNATEKIVDFWRKRWLLKRIKVPGILENVSSFSSDVFTPKHSYNRQGTDKEKTSMSDQFEKTKVVNPQKQNLDLTSTNILDVQFIQLLYLKRRSYADFLNGSVLEAFHIPTPLDDFIIDAVRQGISVILTGNAGDGKTHLLRWLKNRLGDIRMVEDASVLEPEEIVIEWEKAIVDDKPFCLAANEWPLLELVDTFSARLPILNEVRKQLETGLDYKDSADVLLPVAENSSIDSKLIVVNLDLRNPLAPDFVEIVLDTLLKKEIFSTCSRCPGESSCDALRNRNLIMDKPRVREALKSLINRLSIFSRHITVRELLGFVSYVVFGGHDCSTLVLFHGKNNGYYSEHVFDENAHGTLFELLRKYFDPTNISHPKWDAYLTISSTKDSDWVMGEPPLPPALTKDSQSFQFLKRRFFFEHASGQEILKMLPNDEKNFSGLLDPDNHDLDLARDDLVQSINAFFCQELAVPDKNPNNDLIVWSAHSYDERVSRAFTSWFFIDRMNIRLYRPQLGSLIKDAFPYYPNHLLFSVNHSSNPINLLIDFDLFHTLMEVRRGLPSVMVDEGRSVRLYRFMSRLEGSRPPYDSITRIRSYTVQGHDILTAEVDTQRKRIRMLS